MENNGLLSWGVLALALANLGYIFLKGVVPIITKYLESRQKKVSKEDELELKREEAEDRLSFEAKEFLNQAAKDHIATIKTIADDCQEELKELRKNCNDAFAKTAELQAVGKITSDELGKIRIDLSNTRDTLLFTKEALEEAQGQVSVMQRELIVLHEQVAALKKKSSELESALDSEKKLNRELEYQLERAVMQLKDREAQIQEKERMIKSQTEEINTLKLGVEQYKRIADDMMHRLEALEQRANKELAEIETKRTEEMLAVPPVELSATDIPKEIQELITEPIPQTTTNGKDQDAVKTVETSAAKTDDSVKTTDTVVSPEISATIKSETTNKEQNIGG